MSGPALPPRSTRLLLLFCGWLTASALGALLGLAWLADAPLLGARAWIFAHAALFSSVATLALVPALCLLPVALLVRPAGLRCALQAALWTLFLMAVYADTRVYALFRYHVNGMVWNLLATGGAGDSVQITAANWLVFAGAGLVAGLLFARGLRALEPRLARAAPRTRRRAWRYGLAAALGLVLLEKGLYARADLLREREITALARSFPLYQRLTVERLAARTFGMQLEARPKVVLAGEGLLLRYPLEKPRVDPAGPRPNILVVVIDSLRADAFTPEGMPRLSAYARGARVFRDHLSGGNATRFGVFSLIYGLHGAYWKSVLEEHAPAVLVTRLQELGYEMHAFSGPTLSSPEFRSTAFVSMESEIEDAFPHKEKHEKDSYLAARFGAWQRERRARGETRPFFVFALLDSPHQAYSYPKGGERFLPSAGEIDYLAMAGGPAPEQIEAVRNRFRNAVFHADGLLGGMLDELAALGELERTLVAVTGDHGEEFLEHGHFGHTSNFSPEQVHVTFVLGGPGVPRGEETRPTAHVDLAPTLLELLGADPAQRRAWCSGESLLAPPAARARVIAAWDELGLWVEEGILRIPLEGHRGGIEAFRRPWTSEPDEDLVLVPARAALSELALECRRFLR